MENEVLDGWIKKAEADFNTAKREFKVTRAPNHDAVCILSQQCAEKYLKAFKVAHKSRYPYVHDLIKLLNECLRIDSSFEFLRNECETLTGMYRLRYPGDFADPARAGLALNCAKRIREFVRLKLGLAKSQVKKRR